ncbi:tripartite tricarboxylate transporter substrate binding protein [Microbacteriaceae bacterium K1510]|nr:tripartite tricarboxylate transporter substrate binding protein [Microbacteriaceae bacterium K1510]
MVTRRQFSAGLLTLCLTSRAFGYPTRQLAIVVPFSPGASADGVSRIVAAELGPLIKATVVVENRPGGGGVTGLQSVSRGNPDGQIVAIGATGAIVVAPNVPGAPAFDPLADLAPVAKLVDIPIVLVSNPQLKLDDIPSVVARAKQLPNGLSFASTGVNTAQHLSIELLKRRTGANLIHIPYKGSAPAVTDVLSGQVPLACVDLTSAVAHIKAGTLTAVGVTAATRYALASDIPTFAEQGVNGFELTAWLGMFAPANAPAEVITELANSLRECVASPHTAGAIQTLACSPSYLGPIEFKQLIVAQSSNIRQVIGAKSP